MQASLKPKRKFWSYIKKPGKQAFWLWITYQAVKGTATTIFIWAPLIYLWLKN